MRGDMIPFSKRDLLTWESLGKIPPRPPTKPGKYGVYRQTQLDRWLKEQLKKA